MTALSYTSGTAILTYMAADGQSITGAGSTAICATIASVVNDRLEQYVQRPIGPGGTAARTYDGDGTDELWIPEGINGITTLVIYDATGGTAYTMGSTEYALRPHSHQRPTGWPAFLIKLTDLATTQTSFTWGYDTVSVTPDSTGWGWTSIPVELTNLADRWGVKMYQDRAQTGGGGEGDFNAVAYSYLTPEDKVILNRYRMTVAQTYVR